MWRWSCLQISLFTSEKSHSLHKRMLHYHTTFIPKQGLNYKPQHCQSLHPCVRLKNKQMKQKNELCCGPLSAGSHPSSTAKTMIVEIDAILCKII
mmetsp:Transcript_37475/g.45772  ORF Transcript_37475/g.45772 Transcript_37475/m.45772 type:complete len:95 (+) Transcript_37475:180-464(+)